jgi:DNA polymerase III delta prime subunit
MNIIEVHKEKIKKLDYFIEIQKIPNIIFHGPSGSGKRTIVNNFIQKIYNYDQEIIKNNMMHVNCAHGKGIKFIREDLKFFAKTNINFLNGNFFKTIILFNADKLTIDAQSALRRCIELFSHTTRFFIIVEDKYKLLKPILSRFCEIYLPLPTINSKNENVKRLNNLNKILQEKVTNYLDLFKLTEKLYNKAYSGLDLINYIENSLEDNKNKYKLLIIFQKFKKEFRNEKTCILFLLNYIYFRSNDNLENIAFM